MFKTYFISRHAGAQDWALAQGIEAEMVSHFDPSVVKDGDIVMGTLPVQMVAAVVASGARYLHLTMSIPAEMRGKEISSSMMNEMGASLQEFTVKAI